MIPAVGQGYIAMDCALIMAVAAAATVQAYYLPRWWRAGKGFAVIRILRLTGWLILGARYGQILATVGDIAISIPAAIAVFFLAGAEVAQLFNRGKAIPL